MGALTPQQSRHHPQALKVLPARSPGGNFREGCNYHTVQHRGTLERPGISRLGSRGAQCPAEYSLDFSRNG
jgi:hypothetical protein